MMSSRQHNLMQAATRLAVARDLLHSAKADMLATVEREDAPDWEWARTAESLEREVDKLRLEVHDGAWRAA